MNTHYEFCPPTNAEFEACLIETELSRVSYGPHDAASEALHNAARATLDKIRQKPGPHMVDDRCAGKDALRKLAALLAIDRMLSSGEGFSYQHGGRPGCQVQLKTFPDAHPSECVELTMRGPLA